VRFDLRNPNMALFSSLVAFASKHELAILDLGQERALPRNHTALLRAAAESAAANFVIDPMSFLDQVRTGDTRAT